MFRFYKTILNLKTRLQEQNLNKILSFFSLSFKPVHLLQNKWMNIWMNIFTEWNFSNRIKFFEWDTNIYFEYITLFETKKIFTEKNNIFVKIIHIFFLKIYIFFQIVLLHLNNHSKSSRSNDVIVQRKINNGKYSALMGRRRSMLLVVGWVLYKFRLLGYWF